MRINLPEFNSLIGKKFPVLDDGFIRVIDYMGGDDSIVQAARVSYGTGTKKVSEDEGLIRYLMRHGHTTPFEMCELKIHVRVPMDTWRQWIRHRTASVNEYSTRYSKAIDSCQTTNKNEWRLQGKGNKQGSFGYVTEFPKEIESHLIAGDYGWKDPGELLSYREKELQNFAREVYNERLMFDVAREQARKDLTLSTYTEAYWKIDLKNLLGFLGLRMDSHAQKEIRDYATILGEEIVAKWVPLTWKAFNDYHPLRGGMTLSARDIAIIAAMQEESSLLEELLDEYKWMEVSKKTGEVKPNRERSECEEKLKRLGLQIPWK